MVEPIIQRLSEILLMPRTFHASGNSFRICLGSPLDLVATLQRGCVNGATVELERHPPGEGSLFPGSGDPRELLWVLIPQDGNWEIKFLRLWNTPEDIRPVIW